MCSVSSVVTCKEQILLRHSAVVVETQGSSRPSANVNPHSTVVTSHEHHIHARRSTMSSLARARSLRKPGAASSDTSAAKDTDRHGSPSRLPVKPHARTASTTTSSASTTGLKTSRPLSGTLGRTASTRKAAEPSKREASHYPPSTTTTRAAPAPRPTSSGSGQPTQARRMPTHTRAKSTTTATTLNPSTVLRPPSQDATSTTRTAHTRKVSAERSTRPAAPATQAPARTQQQQPKLRPTFSTLQQHYSPAKSRDPKPLTSTYLVPPSPSKLPANIVASAETSRLQAELLQLHLLHRDAASVDAQWRDSAKEKLGERLARLGDAAAGVADRERESLERESVLALRSWGSGGGLEEKIQALDAAVNGIWTLSEPGGRYARMVRRFERWMDEVCEVEGARKDGTYMFQGGQNLFIGELDASWKDDCSGMMRRLEGWRRQLRYVGEPPEDEGTDKSSLRRMLDGSRALVHDMLSELTLMEEIEQEALAREDQWIEKMNRDDDDNDTPRAGAVWRVV